MKVGDLIRHKGDDELIALVLATDDARKRFNTTYGGPASSPGCYIQFRWLDDGTIDSCHSSLFEVISEGG